MNKVSQGLCYNNNIPTTTVSISSSRLSECDDVVKTMLQLGIMTSVTNNKSVICNQDKCWLETGCRLIFGGISKKDLQSQIWNPLQTKYGLSCAHLNIQGVYSGCILDYLRETKCQGPIG